MKVCNSMRDGCDHQWVNEYESEMGIEGGVVLFSTFARLLLPSYPF